MNLFRARLRFSRLLPLASILFALPATAQAHTPIEGIGDFLAGLVHPLTTPSHILLLLALGLMLGQHSPLKLKLPILVFVSASAIALLLTTTGLITRIYQPVLLVIALCAATFVALEKSLSPVAVLTLFAAAELCTKKSWLKVGIRVAGSWIIAITLLVLAFSLRK